MKKLIVSFFCLLLCTVFALSVIDTHELRQKTNFDQNRMLTHIEKLTENGPRSVANKEANEKAIEYIVSEMESYGFVNEDTTEKPAYLVHEYVAEDERYQNWYLKDVIVHIPANAENKTGEIALFMGHLDSVPMGNGASDDGVACATMLEAIRYYSEKMQNGYTLKNDLLFCFVNGEEYGLYGSKALVNEFKGFADAVSRTKFVTNLESRGTSGTLIMFETAANNYNTVKLFSEVNKNIFTCSIATLVYDSMPNSTDFTSFKDFCQGINMANITGGENYHTQNDKLENISMSYLSQQAQIVDRLIEALSDYDMKKLYASEESANFFSYLNITTVIYSNTAAIILAIICILLLAINIFLAAKKKTHSMKNTSKAMVALIIGLISSAAAAYLCYFIFQWIAVLFGVMDIHMVGTITYSNTVIVIGIALLSLAITIFTSNLFCKIFKIEPRDMTRAFAYLHAVLGIALCFALPSASYLFIFSGLLLTANEVLITAFHKKEIEKLHLELLVTALYFPIVIPVLVLATSALGLTMAYVYGLVFALSLFAFGIFMVPVCKRLSLRAFKKEVSPNEGASHILAAALVLFLCVSLTKTNASVNLQGKQNIVKLPYDDALVYVLNENGEYEYRIYDLNAYRALQKYSPDMSYSKEYYVGKGEKKEISLSILSVCEGNTLTVQKSDENALVYLDIQSTGADSFTIDDGITSKTYVLTGENYQIKLHKDCQVTFHGAANVSYREVIRDYAPLIPTEYANDENQLHFNLWMTANFTSES